MGRCKDQEGEVVVLSRNYEGSRPEKLRIGESNLRKSGEV
jgi:hypothetical protein